MHKSIIVILSLCMIFISQTAWAQLTPDQEERLRQLESKEKAWKAWEEERSKHEERLWELSGKGKTRTAKEEIKREFIKPSFDEDVGRFQAVRMNNNTVFILDTKQGHLWIWIIQSDKEGKSNEYILYQGQVFPGDNMGEIINRTYKK